MTRETAVKIYNAIEKIKNYKDKEGKSIKLKKDFAINSIYNKKILQAEYDILVELSKPLQELIKEREEKRMDIVKIYCDKDDKGNPIVNNDTYTITKKEDQVKVNNEVNELFKEYEAQVTEADNIVLDSSKEEITLDKELKKYKSSDLPDEVEFEDIEVLFDIVED